MSNSKFTKESIKALKELPGCPIPTSEDKLYCWHLDHRDSGAARSDFLIESVTSDGEIDETWACIAHAMSYVQISDDTISVRVMRIRKVN